MLAREFPASTILVDAQSTVTSKMPPERQAAPATFEANDVIGVDRSPDRHGGSPLSLNFGCRFSESRECLMDGRNQRRELIGPDLVSPNICSNDIGSEFSIE